MNQNSLNRVHWRLTGVIMVVVMAALAGVSALSHRTFEQSLTPEMAQKAYSVMASVRSLMLKAIEYRLSFNELYGVEQAFEEVREETPEFRYIAATDAEGRVIYSAGVAPEGVNAYFQRNKLPANRQAQAQTQDAVHVNGQYLVTLPIVSPHGPLGSLHIGIDGSFVDSIMLELLLDVVVILIVSLFFTLEMINFLARARLQAGLKVLDDILERGRAGDFSVSAKLPAEGEFNGILKLIGVVLARVNAGFMALTKDIEAARRVPAHERMSGLSAAQAGLQELRDRYRFGHETTLVSSDTTDVAMVRAPLFAFILAEELTRSFLPSYVSSLLVPIPGVSAQIVIGLPIVLFMLIVAFGQPYLGAYCERLGQRRAMGVGAAVATAGFLGSALAFSVIDLLLWRGLCAFGYAMVFIAAQAYVLDHTDAASRARGFAVFVGAIMVATVCGPSIGGILSDNIGHRATFIISAVLAFASIWAIRLMPERTQAVSEMVSIRPPRLAQIAALLVNRRFITLTGLAAIPAKIILTGVCFYLMPLFIISIGSNQSMAGRMLMAYAVVMVLMSPVAAALANTRQQREALVIGGLIISGLGGVVMLAGGGVMWVLLAVLLIGLGQSMSITAQSALVSDQCHEEIARMGDHAVYGVYRFLERLGNAMGPLIAAALVMVYGYQQSFVIIGGAVLVCGLAFWALTRESQPATQTSSAG